MKKSAKKFSKFSNLKMVVADKVVMLSLVLFILAIFLLDVNANNIAAYGLDTQVGLINGIKIPATNMFWVGFIAACIFFFLLAIRSMYHHKKYPSRLDLFSGIVGIIGLMIILTGGLLVFWHDNAFTIPFFSMNIARIDFYHSGIGLAMLSMFYFALTK